MNGSSLRRILASIIALLGMALPSLAAAQTQYAFLLEPDAGSGLFTVDDAAVPAFGTANVRADTFEGVLRASFGGSLGTMRFGYSIGNSSVVVRHVIQPDGSTRDVVEPQPVPDVNAVISFRDGAPTGIGYIEFHSTLEPLAPGGMTGSFVSMFGLTWNAFANRFSVSGPISISAPIPEPATYGLLLAGLAVVGVAVRRAGVRDPRGRVRRGIDTSRVRT